MQNNAVVILVGPSCSGKSFLSQKLMKKELIGEAVSTTTRNPRNGEVDGIHYHFVKDAEFEKKKKNGEFIETIEFSDKKYGITADEFIKLFEKGVTPLVVAEPNGVHQVINYCNKAGWTPVSVFINVPLKVAISRFTERMLADLNNDKNQTVIDYYAGRITDAVLIESSWKKMLKYNHIYPVSDGDECADNIADEIMLNVSSLNQGVKTDWYTDVAENKIKFPPELPSGFRDKIKENISVAINAFCDGDKRPLLGEILKIVNREKTRSPEELEC